MFQAGESTRTERFGTMPPAVAFAAKVQASHDRRLIAVVDQDHCPTCGRRITDDDDHGFEAGNGQRYCVDHHPVGCTCGWAPLDACDLHHDAA